MLKLTLIATFFSISALIGSLSVAAPVTIEIATILPDGTGGSTALRAFSKSIESETKGEVRFKFIWGGNAGTDSEVLSQIRSGNLKGAMFAGQIMEQIAPEIRESEIPFQFGNDRLNARTFISKNAKAWSVAIGKSGFHNLGFYEAGFVYLCSKNPIKSLKDVSSAKIWLWPGDSLGRTVIEELRGTPTEIPVQDSYKAFADGRLEIAYAPAIAIIALQWYTKAKNLVVDPISYANGSILIDQKVWSAISSSNQAVISRLAPIAIEKINDAAAQDERESLDAFKSLGINLTHIQDSDKSRLTAINKSVRNRWKKK